MSKKSPFSKYNFPRSIKVSVTKSSKGFTATVEDLPGCITFARNFPELIENVNDAVLTYFEVPRKDAMKVDFMYIPDPSSRERKVKPAKKRGKEFIRVSSPDLLYA